MACIWWPKPDATSNTSGLREEDVQEVEVSMGERASAMAGELRSAEPWRDHDMRYLASSAFGCGVGFWSVAVIGASVGLTR